MYSVICIYVPTALLLSKCGVNGTSVSFHCPGAVWWYINQRSAFHWQENITLLADSGNAQQFSNGSDALNTIEVVCKASGDKYHFAELIVTGKRVAVLASIVLNSIVFLPLDPQSPEPPLYPTLLPDNRTTLSLGWRDLASDSLVDYNYEVVLTIEENHEVFNMEGMNQTFLTLDLKGYECQDFEISISVPGNCESAVISGSLLIGKLT